MAVPPKRDVKLQKILCNFETHVLSFYDKRIYFKYTFACCVVLLYSRLQVTWIDQTF
jgi:hypothetical protein